MRAAAVLTHEHSIQTNLSLVSCLSHASACIEAGAKMITMSVGKVFFFTILCLTLLCQANKWLS